MYYDINHLYIADPYGYFDKQWRYQGGAWTIIMQNLKINEWKLLELQITQTRIPLSTLDGKNSKDSWLTDSQC